MSEKRAIIDIGSNTVRLVIYNGPPRAPVVLLNEKVTARLGRDVAESGLLSDKAMQVALAALRRYAALLELSHVTDVQTVATAAVRDAHNGPQFLREVQQLGLQPRLLSGEEEARTSATGVIAAFPGAEGIAGDLGGGSLELTRIEGNACHEGISLPLGSLRLTDLRAGGDEGFAATVREMLDAAGWTHGSGERFYIVGGSWRAIGIYAMHLLDWPLDDPHDFALSAQQALEICGTLAREGPTVAVPRIASSRLETLSDAAALLAALIEVMGPSRIVFSSWGLREGLLYTALPEAERVQHPMTVSVAAFVGRYDVKRESAQAIVDWIGGVVPDTGTIDPALPLAATMLSLASMRTEPNVRATEALDWALRKRWVGMDARGRALVAAVMLANTGQTEFPESLRRFASDAELEWAVRWGLAVRLARKLTNCSSIALDRSTLRAGTTQLTLALDDLTEPLYTSAVAKILSRLAQRLALEPDQERFVPA
jgi:exopolyphosphatase/guanosine-5'-triphosphate,3'-diphosphate pyrophosphatase